jgi:hypothetical protein
MYIESALDYSTITLLRSHQKKLPFGCGGGTLSILGRSHVAFDLFSARAGGKREAQKLGRSVKALSWVPGLVRIVRWQPEASRRVFFSFLGPSALI